MYKFSIVVLCVISFLSCNDVDETDKGKEVTTPANEIAPAYEVVGTYKDTLPCASCPGIATNIIFSADKKVQKTELYLERDEYSRSVSGIWEMESPERIKVTYSDETEYYLLQSDEAIRLVNAAQQDTTALSQHYLLKKERAISDPLALNGSYSQVMEDGDTQLLKLTALNNQVFQVAVGSSPHASAGCNFSGKGKFVNNRIEINLATIESSLKGTMTITISGDTATIFTAEEAQRYDLMFFCSGGASLAGIYVKQ